MQKHRRTSISAAEVTVFIAQTQQETSSTRVHYAARKLVMQPFFPWKPFLLLDDSLNSWDQVS